MIMKRLTRPSSVCHLVVLLAIVFLNKTKELPFVLFVPFFGQDFRQELEVDKITSEQYNIRKVFHRQNKNTHSSDGFIS